MGKPNVTLQKTQNIKATKGSGDRGPVARVKRGTDLRSGK
jgi:hypothetical protein